MTKMLALCFSLAAAACAPALVGSSAFVPVPHDAAATCSDYCKSLGLTLGSVVIMASNVGCVCNAASAPGVAACPAPSAEAAGGGMAAILIQQEAARHQQPPTPGYGPLPPPAPPSPARH